MPAFCAFGKCGGKKECYDADIVVYGGTSGAVVSAIRAAQSGKKVFLVSPDTNLGAMSSSGLGMTDSGNTAAIGGLSLEFYKRVYAEYQKDSTGTPKNAPKFKGHGRATKAIRDHDKTMWIFEPRIALTVFKNWLAEHPEIAVHRGEYLDRENGVEKVGKKIKSITTLSGKKYRAKSSSTLRSRATSWRRRAANTP